MDAPTSQALVPYLVPRLTGTMADLVCDFTPRFSEECRWRVSPSLMLLLSGVGIHRQGPIHPLTGVSGRK